MPWSVLIPDTDPKQVLRMRRYLMAASTSFLVVFLLVLSYAQGLLALPVLIEATAIICALIAMIYAVFRSGLNRRFPDPSLTMEQIILASVTVVYVMYQAGGLRGVLLPVYLMPLLFGVFGLNRVRSLLLVLLLLFAYAGMVLLYAYTKPGGMDPATEVMLFVVLCTVLPWFAVMGGYFHGLRERLGLSRGELRQALEELQRTNQKLQDSHAELDRLASTDKLTGVWNRRRMDEAVASEMDRLKRYAHPLSLLLLDIDFFKKVNDRFGHAAGDQLLVELAAKIRSALRLADSLTRWGGEEFVVLCPNTELSAAGAFAERLRKTIAGMKSSVVNEITVSIGVAECLPGETWEIWFQRADAALYRAKASGRNQVQIAPGMPAQPRAGAAVSGNLVQLVWRSAYECGHEVVDREHQALFGDSNDLLTAIVSGRPAGEVDAVIDTLIRDLVQHFQDEESIIAAAGYPGAAAHAAIHCELLNRAGDLVERFRAGMAHVGELFQFLAKDVVAKHILGADRDFCPYLENQRRLADR
jgi:diguanylate cyclase (GGDEF)-like protein/hemerythrin-like metal-binding protein